MGTSTRKSKGTIKSMAMSTIESAAKIEFVTKVKVDMSDLKNSFNLLIHLNCLID